VSTEPIPEQVMNGAMEQNDVEENKPTNNEADCMCDILLLGYID
jgi:hypothetical protein